MIDQILSEFNLFHFAIICLAFSLGGLVKGISSFGLPTISVPILIMVLPLPQAMSVLAIPLVLSNLYQTVISGDVKGSVQRHWNLYLPILLTLPIGVYFLAIADVSTLTLILGVLLVIVTSMELKGLTFSFVKEKQNIVAPLVGVFSGVIGGMTSLFAIMPIFFLVAIGLEKERFVSAVSIMLFSGSTLLAICLQQTDNLGPLEVAYGILGMIPIMLSIWIGTMLRQKVDQTFFRKVVLSLILIIGLSMIYRAFI